MFITMHCMGMPFNGNTINEKSLGGSETAAYYMAKELAAQGHKVTIFTNHPEEGTFDDVRYIYAGEPTEQTPLGDRFHHYAANTPHDVLIIQRQPHAFHYKWASKVNLLWMHDLALKRYEPAMQGAIHNITGVLTVSEMHKQQVCEVYGLKEDFVYPITNGIDLSMYEDTEPELPFEMDSEKKYLLYSSRPERGLENLVRPEGIMHQLWEDGQTDVHLIVCGYDNTTPAMEALYNQLWSACDILPNVTNVGSLTKQQLAQVQKQAYLHVYPTTFEEVSCITAMETMAAGLPFLSSEHAALTETCSVSKGCKLIKLDNEQLNPIRFMNALKALLKDDIKHAGMKKAQLAAAEYYSWENAAKRLSGVINNIFGKASPGAILRHLIRNSDIYAADKFTETIGIGGEDLITDRCIREIRDCYQFAWTDTFDEHYANYYQYEKDRGVDYGPERLDGNPRFETVSAEIGKLNPGSTVLDYGCAHGHYTVTLSRRFPEVQFVGVDITASNVEKARRWAKEEALDNVSFIHGRIDTEAGCIVNYEGGEMQQAVNSAMVGATATTDLKGAYDAIIAAEVIEHVSDADKHVDVLHGYLADMGELILTTPYGPWEAIGYREHHPWRAHLWHFDRADIQELWGHFNEYNVICAPSGATKEGEPIGSYITTFTKTDGAVTGLINYDRKFHEIMPRETVSLCMIAKDCEDTLKRTLDSLVDAVDEVNIYIDPTTSDRTREIAHRFAEDSYPWPVVNVRDLTESPLESGFDVARNESISEASGDWIMWIDTDEYVSYPEHITPYLCQNGLNGYAMKQHHFALEPVGVMKTDFPVRLFRNNIGVQFYGVVHEHPEIKMNEGVGNAWLIPDVDIGHAGYTNEAVRRGRFNRNIDLMYRDREKNPNRYLGKFLWIRDVAQLIGYELERGQQLQPHHYEMVNEALGLWDDLLKANQIRMLADGIQFYSRLVQTLGDGFEFSFKLDTGRTPGKTSVDNVQPITGYFPDKEKALQFFNAIMTERVKDYGHKYE